MPSTRLKKQAGRRRRKRIYQKSLHLFVVLPVVSGGSCGCELTYPHEISIGTKFPQFLPSWLMVVVRVVASCWAAAEKGESSEIQEQQPELRMFKCFSAALFANSFSNRPSSDGPPRLPTRPCLQKPSQLLPGVGRDDEQGSTMRNVLLHCYLSL